MLIRSRSSGHPWPKDNILDNSGSILNRTDCRALELLAPARDYAVAIEAIKHGADAVYMGGPSHGARAAAGNSIDDIRRVVEYAHQFDVRVYVTLNTIVYDPELAEVEKLVHRLYRAGIDALIVQDMALLRLDLPPIALHASTQCDIRDVSKARFMENVGFSQIVLARELSLGEISGICHSVKIPVEVFVHGALCVSYSGDCQASCMTTGRSANRGQCAQVCRLPYDLVDENGKVLIGNKHLLSLRDMNRLAYIGALADAGVSSFKIEGRLKDVAYVKNVVAAYSAALDAVVDADPDKYCRSSSGGTELGFSPRVEKSFNRGFTSYYLFDGNLRDEKVSSVETPKWIGEPAGSVIKNCGRYMIVSANGVLNNGDGMGYFGRDGVFTGFRLNRVDGDRIYMASPVDAVPGTELFRNHDEMWEAAMSRQTAVRYIDIDMTLRSVGNDRISLQVMDCRGNDVETAMDCLLQQARTPQEEARKRALSRIGDTIYRLRSVNDRLGDRFVPVSLLTELRRKAIGLLDSAQKTRYYYSYRLPECKDAPLPHGRELTYHDNVANAVARDFYVSHGALSVEPALETGATRAGAGGTVVMTTRYCLRREMGACLKSDCARRLPRRLFLKSNGILFRLDFDCSDCRMKVVKV